MFFYSNSVGDPTLTRDNVNLKYISGAIFTIQANFVRLS